MADEIEKLRDRLRKGVLDDKIQDLMDATGTDNLLKMTKVILDENSRTYTMSDQFQMMMLMSLVMNSEIDPSLEARRLYTTSLLQDTLDKRIRMIDVAEKKEEKDIARRIEAVYVSEEIKAAREVAAENARLKKELEESKKRLDGLNEEIVLRARDIVGKIFATTPPAIAKLVEKAANDAS